MYTGSGTGAVRDYSIIRRSKSGTDLVVSLLLHVQSGLAHEFRRQTVEEGAVLSGEPSGGRSVPHTQALVVVAVRASRTEQQAGRRTASRIHHCAAGTQNSNYARKEKREPGTYDLSRRALHTKNVCEFTFTQNARERIKATGTRIMDPSVYDRRSSGYHYRPKYTRCAHETMSVMFHSLVVPANIAYFRCMSFVYEYYE